MSCSIVIGTTGVLLFACIAKTWQTLYILFICLTQSTDIELKPVVIGCHVIIKLLHFLPFTLFPTKIVEKSRQVPCFTI